MKMQPTPTEQTATPTAAVVVLCLVLYAIVVMVNVGCTTHPVWYLDTVATEGGEPGTAQVTVDTVWGRTDWQLTNGVLYVGSDGKVVKYVWGGDNGEEPTP